MHIYVLYIIKPKKRKHFIKLYKIYFIFPSTLQSRAWRSFQKQQQNHRKQVRVPLLNECTRKFIKLFISKSAESTFWKDVGKFSGEKPFKIPFKTSRHPGIGKTMIAPSATNLLPIQLWSFIVAPSKLYFQPPKSLEFGETKSLCIHKKHGNWQVNK